MPAGKKAAGPAAATGGSETKGNAALRTAYRPPWVKESAEPNKETETPWGIMKKRDSIMDPEETKKRLSAAVKKDAEDDEDAASNFAIPALRKVSVTKVEKPQENGEEKEVSFMRPALKSVKTKQREPRPLTKEDSKIIIPKLNAVKVEKMMELPPPPKKDNPDYRQVLKKAPTRSEIDAEEKKRGIPKAPPMAPPMPPPAPSMPKLVDNLLSEEQKQKIDSLRARPKTRPDWSALLKGIETGAKLKKVQCNDRSQPVLPGTKAKGQFLYESEKGTAHNVLLKEIQSGRKLKSVKTNDRSKPNLEGLRKFRRQMTVEEQIQKSISMACMAPVNCPSGTTMEEAAAAMAAVEAEEVDELDDIDKVRDDLQSTKQLLAIELRNKDSQAREIKRLQTKINNMEKETEIEKSIDDSEKNNPGKVREPDEKLIVTLKAEAAEARRRSEDLEKKYTQTATKLDTTKFDLEEEQKKNAELEKKLQELLSGKRFSVSASRRGSQMPGEDGEMYDDMNSESEEEESDEKKAKRIVREVKMMANKLSGFKTKVENAKKERIVLKDIVKKHQSAIRAEKKNFKQLQKEVNKMAALMKETDSDEDEDEEEAEDEEADDDTETESSETETESSDSESDSEKSQSEPEDAAPEKKKENLNVRSKRHENRLSALKKTNFMLKANAERLQDDLNKQKEMTQTLREDLDSVLAELG